MSEGTTTRRQFVTGAALAGSVATSIAVHPDALASTGTLEATARANIVLHGRSIEIDSATRARLVAEGARFIELGDDSVRQWRDEIGVLLDQPGTRLLGLTSWPDFLILRGMAAESRRHVHHESRANERGVLTWLIA